MTDDTTPSTDNVIRHPFAERQPSEARPETIDVAARLSAEAALPRISDHPSRDNSHDWTPRDALLDVLRKMDEGKVDPTALVVVYRDKLPEDNPNQRPGYSLSAPDKYVTQGMLSLFLHQLQMGDYR